MSKFLDGEWILYERVHEKYTTYPKYFMAKAGYYDENNRGSRDAFLRRELCRGTEAEVRKMRDFVEKVNEDLT